MYPKSLKVFCYKNLRDWRCGKVLFFYVTLLFITGNKHLICVLGATRREHFFFYSMRQIQMKLNQNVWMSGYAKNALWFILKAVASIALELSFLKISNHFHWLHFSINQLSYLYTLYIPQALEQFKCVPLTLSPTILSYPSSLDEWMTRCIKKWSNVWASRVVANGHMLSGGW